MELSDQDRQDLEGLEEGLWRTEVRFDLQRMDDMLADDFFEFGRSSRIYARADTLEMPARPIRATLPLVIFKARLLGADVAQITYASILTHDAGEEHALRSSIWSRTPTGWRLRFHQGTAIPLNAISPTVQDTE